MLEVHSLMYHMTPYTAAKGSCRGRNDGASFLLFVFAAFVLGLGVPVYPAELPRDVPTPSEIIAAYRQNFALLLPIAATYEREQVEGIGLIETDRLEAFKQQGYLTTRDVLLGKIDLPPGSDKLPPDVTDNPEAKRALLRAIEKDAKEAPKKLEYLVKRLEPDYVTRRLNEPRRWRHQWWCDQKSFHVRWPKHQGVDCANIDSVKLDAGPITPESLEKNYGLVQMISRSAKNNPPARFWYGTENGPPGPAGEIGSASLRTRNHTYRSRR